MDSASGGYNAIMQGEHDGWYDQWTGDFDELRGREEDLASDRDLCEHVFMDKHEAFLTGLRLGADGVSRDR